ncbi:MurR/RpiR family transcriptional regulator [Tetragenococcus solitarius]|uniref:MurR/RpiR family transcriptional regulator n=1 Tax=Tetragenococcus solitarius TaxID=71453 RepID=A0ABP6KIQ4_9ENTE|nr:MurR/RpiR family transcriptional regulator [Tetragenococcus solitarius]
MSLTENLRSQSNFTEIERNIADYALNNMKKVSRMTIKEFANAAGVSEASVVRFCKNIGVKGFREFKLVLNQELVLRGKDSDFNIVKKHRKEELTSQDILFNTLELDRLAVDQLFNTLDTKSVEQAVKRIAKSNIVVVYGAGASSMVAEDLTHKFTKLGLSTFFNRDFHYMLSIVLNMQEGDTFIAISTTGQTQEVLELSELAKKRKGTVISITTLQKSKLVKQSDILLSTPVLEEYFRVANLATRISQLVVVDVLYMNLYEKFDEEVTPKLFELRDAVKKYRN